MPARSRRRVALVGAAGAVLLAGPDALRAQAAAAPAPAAPKSRWERTIELNGNYLYGNTEQAILGVRTGVLRNDSTFAVRFDTRYTIGVTSGADGKRFMDRRSWSISTNGDYQQYGRESQFVFASLEQSFELRVDRRASVGFGEKVTFFRNDTSRFDVSGGLIGEHSRLFRPGVGGAPDGFGTRTLARLSLRLRYRHAFGSRVSFDHVGWYKPEVSELGQWLGSSSSVVRYGVTKRTGLTLTLYNEYDSQARDRGVRSNITGQVLIGLVSKF